MLSWIDRMAANYCLSAFFFVLSGVFLYLAAIGWFRKLLVAGRIFAVLMISLALYTFGAGMELLLPSLSWMLFWNNVIYFGMVWTGPLWLLLAIAYNGNEGLPGRPVLVALAVIPIATLILKYTDGWHHLIYRNIGISEGRPFLYVSFDRGPWYWVNIIHINITLLIGNTIIARTYFQSATTHRRQAFIMLIASLIPWTSMGVYLSGHFLGGIDIIPIVFVITACLFYVGLLRHRLLDNLPITLKGVFEAMSAIMIVLDTENRVVELNGGARRLLGILSHGGAPRSWAEIADRVPGLSKLDISCAPASVDLVVEVDGVGRRGKIHLSPLYGGNGEPSGKTLLIVLREAERPREATESSEDERDIARLVKEMEVNRWYLKSDLTLPGLARKTSMTRNRLSYLLNVRMRKNFNDFVNGYRVSEAQALLLRSPSNVLEIAFAAGFNSKATFYAVFKKTTGLTPVEFAQEIKAPPA